MRVLITGGAGYIGSVAAEMLLDAGHTVVVLDNLSRGHRGAVPRGSALVVGDVRDQAAVHALLMLERIDCVMHFSASSLVGESMQRPEEYFDNNVIGMVRLLEAMRQSGVGRIIFSSSAATYGEPRSIPIMEDEPVNPTNPYGETKAICERLMRWYRDLHGFHFAALRYFNAAGATADHGEDHDPETHLIPLALGAVTGKYPPLAVFGHDYDTPDGTCIRDYIHVRDLAAAHILALERLGSLSECVFNLGNGAGYSVREVIASVARVTGKPVPAHDAPRRAGDPARLVASAERAQLLLGWRPQHADLDEIVGAAWAWMTRYPHGYAD